MRHRRRMRRRVRRWRWRAQHCREQALVVETGCCDPAPGACATTFSPSSPTPTSPSSPIYACRLARHAAPALAALHAPFHAPRRAGGARGGRALAAGVQPGAPEAAGGHVPVPDGLRRDDLLRGQLDVRAARVPLGRVSVRVQLERDDPGQVPQGLLLPRRAGLLPAGARRWECLPVQP